MHKVTLFMVFFIFTLTSSLGFTGELSNDDFKNCVRGNSKVEQALQTCEADYIQLHGAFVICSGNSQPDEVSEQNTGNQLARVLNIRLQECGASEFSYSYETSYQQIAPMWSN